MSGRDDGIGEVKVRLGFPSGESVSKYAIVSGLGTAHFLSVMVSILIQSVVRYRCQSAPSGS